ncbi:MAG: hypothetical protein M1482_10795 [Chloroflexi bacterium]|nr:hypothetical protein [Chloroflexota bacterium]
MNKQRWALDLADLQLAVRQVGYEAVPARDQIGQFSARARQPVRPLLWPALIGMAASALLAALYVAVVAVAQSWSHALALITTDWYFVVAIAAGFGIQMGLLAYMRQSRKARGFASSKALSGVGTGTSTAAMLACCAHHASDLMPLLGLTGAAVFLNDNRVPFMVLGIVSNAFGVLFMLRALRRQMRSASSAAGADVAA